MPFNRSNHSKFLNPPILHDKLRIVKIKEIKSETPTIKSFTFVDEKCTETSPGQYVMVWIPGIDEIPMSLLRELNKNLMIAVKSIGGASAALHELKKGDVLGIRGPYGHGFTSITGNIMIVGGGIGIAPLVPLTKNLANPPTKITFILGATTHEELLFLDKIRMELSKNDGRIIVATEDGSFGFKGLATDPIEQLLKKQKFDMIFTCGPEKMMKKMFQLAEQYKTPIQASLERIMRCSIGLCGSCMIGKFRVCKDGPVFSSEQLREVKNEFGTFKRDFSGIKVKI
ncbi:dihydroorotate dehydrogenase electron transfer subunit [Candidatus Bathyarchaeota archaeon]|nr:dihydroorotate dehydrogenase electron transfer subunit [Candidatus Bathyarchaeota archaeon]